MCDETLAAGKGAVAAPESLIPLSDTPLREAMVEVATPDGVCDAFFVHPAEGAHPGVVLWPDAIGLRPVKQAMARRLAGAGYAVLVINPYYRNTRAPIDVKFDDFRTEEGRTKIMPLMGSLTPEAVESDAKAFVAWLDRQAAVDTGRGIGTQGYCMGGAMAFRAAHAAPERVKAVASFHGGGLVTDKPDSPHQLLPGTRASYLIAPGRDDDERAPDDKDVLRRVADEAGRPAEIEVYSADHGWCVPDAPAWDQTEADRAWSRLLALYAGL